MVNILVYYFYNSHNSLRESKENHCTDLRQNWTKNVEKRDKF